MALLKSCRVRLKVNEFTVWSLAELVDFVLTCPVVIMYGFMVVVLHKFLTVPHTFHKSDILNLPFGYLEAFIWLYCSLCHWNKLAASSHTLCFHLNLGCPAVNFSVNVACAQFLSYLFFFCHAMSKLSFEGWHSLCSSWTLPILGPPLSVTICGPINFCKNSPSK